MVNQNEKLLQRIQSQKSVYNVKLWNSQRQNIEKYITNISEFPFKNYKPTKTFVQNFDKNASILSKKSSKHKPNSNKTPLNINLDSYFKIENKENNLKVIDEMYDLFDKEFWTIDVFGEQREYREEGKNEDEVWTLPQQP